MAGAAMSDGLRAIGSAASGDRRRCRLRCFCLLIGVAMLGASPMPTSAQTADPKPRREAPVPAAPDAVPGMTLEQRCLMERRNREKARAEGRRVRLDPLSPCRSLNNPPLRAEPTPRRVDTPIVLPPPPSTQPAPDRRRRVTPAAPSQPPLR